MKSKVFQIMVVLMVVVMGIAPAFAQEGSSHHVMFDGFGFGFDSALATKVNIVPFAGDPLDYEAPGGPQAPYTEFILYNDTPAPESWFDAVGGIHVFPVAAMAGYTEYENRVQALRDILAQRPDLTAYMAATQNMNDVTLPLLPVLNAAQVLRAQAHYVDTGSVSGVSFITFYAQGPDVLLANSFHYTFQGFSADGSTYISVLIRVHTPLFPSEVPADWDWDSFMANHLTYLNDSIAMLNAASASDFTPSLGVLDALVGSFAFGG